MPRRRARGEGSIRKRKDGRWEGIYSLPLVRPGALPKKKSVYARTQADCAEKLRKLKAEYDGEVETPKNYTVSDMLRDWVNSEKGNWKEGTLTAYASAIANHLEPGLGHWRLQQLTKKRCGSFLKTVKSEGTANLHNTQHTVLHLACNWACQNDLMTDNPLRHIKKLKHEKVKPVIWTPDEAELFLSVVDDPMYKALFHLYLTTGMRRAEGCGLEWESVDLENLLVEVKQQAKNKPGEIVITPPKSKSAYRTIPIPPDTRDLLQAWLAEQSPGSKFVFTNGNGKQPLSPNVVTDRFASFIKKAGPRLRKCRLHDLRHWCNSQKIKDPDYDLARIQKEAGHSDLTTTLNTYGHPVQNNEVPTAKSLTDWGVQNGLQIEA